MRTVEKLDHATVWGRQFGFHPFAWPKLRVWVYAIDGLLIDTGQPYMRQEVLAEVATQRLEQIYVTHHHEDHTGNVAALSRHCGVPVYGSEGCRQRMQDPPRITLAQRLVWGDRPAFGDIVTKEDCIETERYCFDIYATPGHSADMVVLHEPKEGWLFSADLFVSPYIRYFIREESMAQQMDSLRRVLALDFGEVFCAHNPQLQGGRAKLEQKLQFFEEYAGQVQRLRAEGLSARQIFKRMPGREQYFIQALSGGYLSGINMVRSVLRDLEG